MGITIGSLFIPYDLLSFILLVIVGSVFAVMRKELILALIMSFYPALILYPLTPFENFLPEGWVGYETLLLFLIFYVFSFMVINQIISDSLGEVNVVFWEAVLLGVSFGILVALVVYNTIGLNNVFETSDIIDTVFGKPYNFYQQLIPLVLVYFATR